MNPRLGLLTLLGIFFILALAITATEPPAPAAIPASATPTPTPTPEIPSGTLLRVFPELTVLEIQAIQLQNLEIDREFTLARDAEGNWIAPDLEGEVDSASASSIARTLALLPYGRSLNILPETRFTEYGLAPRPRLIFTILKVDGSSHVIAVGNLTDTQHAYFVLADDRDELFQVERGPVDFLANFIVSPPIRLTKQ